MEALALHNGASKVYWEYSTSCIYVVETKRVTPRVKYIDITVYFIKEQFDNGILVPKYEKYSVMPSDMCTKPYPGPIISRSTKCMTGFRFYPTSDIKQYQLMILHDFFVN